ncbi:MAG TPA: hypothetical protein VJV78_21070 [Polyangiales bacterium]|nr:hypothetical protein [Polyangiales bacterium]
MTPGERYRQAWPMTLGIHVFQTLLAASFALPLIGEVTTPDVSLQPAAADALAAMRVWTGLDDAAGRRMLLPLLAAAINYPWLSVAWLRAMERQDSFVGHARYALGRYMPAALISFGTLLGLALLGAGAVGSLSWLHGAFEARLDERTIDLLSLGTLVPFAWLGCWLLNLQDRAAAAISCESPLREALRIAVRHTHARRVALRLLLIAAQGLVALLGALLPRLVVGPGPAAAGVALLGSQAAALGLSCLRAIWLAYVLGWRRLRI